MLVPAGGPMLLAPGGLLKPAGDPMLVPGGLRLGSEEPLPTFDVLGLAAAAAAASAAIVLAIVLTAVVMSTMAAASGVCATPSVVSSVDRGRQNCVTECLCDYFKTAHAG